MYRPESGPEADRNAMQVRIEKNRAGPPGIVDVVWTSETKLIEEKAPELTTPEEAAAIIYPAGRDEPAREPEQVAHRLLDAVVAMQEDDAEADDR